MKDKQLRKWFHALENRVDQLYFLLKVKSEFNTPTTKAVKYQSPTNYEPAASGCSFITVSKVIEDIAKNMGLTWQEIHESKFIKEDK